MGGWGDGGPIPASAGFLWRQDWDSVCVCVGGGEGGGGGVNGGLKAFSVLHLQSSFGGNTGWVFFSSDIE